MGFRKTLKRFPEKVKRLFGRGDGSDPGSNAESVKPSQPSPQVSPPAQQDQIHSPEKSNAGAEGKKPSLWDRAFVALKEEDTQLLDKYTDLLKRALPDIDPAPGTPSSSKPGVGTADARGTSHNLSQLESVIGAGLRKVDESKIRYTIFGHEFFLGQQVTRAVEIVTSMEAFITEAVKVSPEASLAWVGVRILLPIFLNPHVAGEASRCGLIYVSSRMKYHASLEHLLWPENLKQEASLKDEFENLLIDLYKNILSFRIKSALRFYESRIKQVGKDVMRLEDWDQMRSDIEGLEERIRNESQILNQISARESLEKLNAEAKKSSAHMQELIALAKKQIQVEEEQLLAVTKHLDVGKEHLDIGKEQLLAVTKHLDVGQEHRDIGKEQLNIVREQLEAMQRFGSRLLKLPRVEKASYNSADVHDSPKCNEGTRKEIRSKIEEWAKKDSAPVLFWLHGPAGTGKSTIARTVADSLSKEEDYIVAGYFFKRGEEGRNKTDYVFPTIASQLAEHIPSFRASLEVSTKDVPMDAIPHRALNDQFNMLLLDPSMHMSETKKPTLTGVVIIIDALDECECKSERIRNMLSCVKKLQNVKSVRIRVFVTSRSGGELRRSFENLQCKGSECTLDLVHDFSDATKLDIETFLTTSFRDIKSEADIEQDPWPHPDQLTQLTRLATTPTPLFIYAATLCRFVYDRDRRSRSSPIKQLNKWLNESNDNKSKLDQIYDPILTDFLRSDDEDDPAEKLEVLGTIVFVAVPLSARALAGLLDSSIDVIKPWIANLHAVLDIPTKTHLPVSLLHKSFSDYLLSRGASGASNPRVDEAETHSMLATKCFERMAHPIKGLRRNICDLQTPDARFDSVDPETLQRKVPADLQYACLYWAHHLASSRKPILDGHPLYGFLKNKFLHWLEVLSLIGKIAEGIRALRGLGEMSQLLGTDSLCTRTIKDAGRFLLNFRAMIQEYPLQIYWSAIIFSPTSSEIKMAYYGERAPEIAHVTGVSKSWDSVLQVIECDESVNSVAISSDSQLLAFTAYGGVIQLLDATTGALVKVIIHSEGLEGIVFSSDNKCVAAFDIWGKPNLWDVETGECNESLPLYESEVTSITFTHKGKTLVLGFADGTIHLRDMEEVEKSKILDGHGNAAQQVAISHDDKVVASSSRDDNTIILWDSESGDYIRTLKGHSDVITAIAFSPDSRRIASISLDKTIRLWDVESKSSHVIGFKGNPYSINFLTGGRAAILGVQGVEVWSLEHTKTNPIRRLKGNSGHLRQVACSPDGKLMAALGVGNIEIYDGDASAQTLEMDKDTEAQVYPLKVIFSEKIGMIASISAANTIQLWDRTGRCLAMLQGNEHGSVDDEDEEAACVAHSPDNSLIAIGSENGTVRVWNMLAREWVAMVKTDDFIHCMAISPRKDTIALSDYDTVRILDLRNPDIQTIHDIKSADVLAYSPDGQKLAVVYMGTEIILIDTEVGKPLHTTIKAGDIIKAVAFSPDGMEIVLVTEGAIETWDITTYAKKAWREAHGVSTLETCDIRYSEDGTRIFTGVGTLALDLSHGPGQALWEPLYFDGHWICHREKRLSKLPPDYFIMAVDHFDQTIVLGDRSGRIIFLSYEGI